MKHLYKIFAFATVAVVALVSCNKENDLSDPNAITIRVRASVDELKGADPESKTYIDTYQGTANTILWGTGEYMKLALTAGETTTFANSTDVSADLFDGDPEAMFEFSVNPGEASEYVYQGIYPASAAATSSNTNAANYKVNLPTVQNATATSYDPAAYIMVVKPETFNTVQTDWEASFRRGTALNKITLKNFASSVSINKVKITAEGKKLAGGRHFNLTTGEGLDVYGSESTIEVKYATPLTGTSMDVWFTTWDAEIAEGEKLTVVAYTTDSKSYTKEITVPAGRSIKFQEGYLNNTGVSMSGISAEDVSEFEEGDYVILAKNGDTYYALKGEVSGTRIASVNYTGSTTSYSGDASLIWTIAASGSSYTIKNNGNYVGWTSGNSADLIAEADYDATKCLMSIDDNGDGTYKISVAADNTRLLARNQSNAYFAFYAGTQYKDIVFVPATTLEVVATPTFSPAAGEVASGTEVTISTATSGATIYYTTDGTDPTSSSAVYSSPIEITATTTIKAIAVKNGMANSEIATATYTVAGAQKTYYVKVTSAPSDWSGQYLIVYESGNVAFNGGLSTLDAVSNTISVTISDSKIESTLTTDAAAFTVAAITEGYSIKSASGYYIGRTANSNGMNTSTSEEYTNSFTYENNAVTITSNGLKLRYNSSSGQTRFRYFTSNQQVIQLYKLDASTTPVDTYDFETVAGLNNLATSTSTEYSGKLTDAVVSFVPDADHAFIKDATGTVQLYVSSGHGLSQGQTFSGDLNVTLVQYNSCSELTACDAEFTGLQSTVLPADMTLASLVGKLATYQNAYVKVKDLEVTNVNGQNLTVSDGDNSYIVYTKYGSSGCVVGDILTVVGTISHYGNNDQITVWALDDLTVDSHPVATELTIAQVIEASVNTSVATSGVVAQVNQKGFILTDGSDNIFVYQNAVPTVAPGQAVTVEGTRSVYNNVAQITSPTITPGATGQTVVRTTLTTVTSSNATGYSISSYVSLTGVLSISGNYYNVSISGSTTQGSLYQLSGSENFTAGEISSLAGKAIIVTGYVIGSNNSYLNIAPIDIELDLTPSLAVSPATTSESPANWPSNNSTAMEFTVTAVNGTWSVSNNGVSSWANVNTSSNKITVTPKTAQSSTANSGSIVITLTPTDNNYSALAETIYLSQAKYEAGKKWSLVSSLSGITDGTYSIAAFNDNYYYTVPNTTISGQTFNCTQASYSATEGLTPPTGAGEFVFTAVSGVNNAFYIYNTNLKKYLVATGSKTFGYVDSSSFDYGYWTFSTVASGGFSGVFSVQHSSKTHYMRAYNNSVRCYDGASNNGVYLFIYN